MKYGRNIRLEVKRHVFFFQLYHIEDIKPWVAINPLNLIFLLYKVEKTMSTLPRLLARIIIRNECERGREKKRERIHRSCNASKMYGVLWREYQRHSSFNLIFLTSETVTPSHCSSADFRCTLWAWQCLKQITSLVNSFLSSTKVCFSGNLSVPFLTRVNPSLIPEFDLKCFLLDLRILPSLPTSWCRDFLSL